MAGPIGTKDLAYQAVEPYQEGLTVKNTSGGSLAVGDLVYVSGTTTSPATGTDPVATVAPGLRVAQVATADLALKGGLVALRASLGIPRVDLGATVLAVAPVVRISVRNP